MRVRSAVRLLPVAFLGAACSMFGRGGGSQSPSSSGARAQIEDARGRDVGDASLQQTPHGVLIIATLRGLPSGTHGMHVHERGRCEAPFESAGGHWNPEEKQHGIRSSAGPHAGDLPNVNVASDGTVRIELFARDLSLRGDRGLLDDDGASIVVHAFADDYASDPAGNSGERIACGVVRR